MIIIQADLQDTCELRLQFQSINLSYVTYLSMVENNPVCLN